MFFLVCLFVCDYSKVNEQIFMKLFVSIEPDERRYGYI